MAITQTKRNIPTVAQAVESFINKNRTQRGVREHTSVLLGARSGRVTGQKAAGTALAKSSLGPLRFDRVSGDEFAAWFHDRHPAHLAPSTLKRGRSSLRQLLMYAIASGWADDCVLAALPPVTASPARREWLRPEQLVALDALVTEEHFTVEQRFMRRCIVNTGLRTEELVRLKPQALNVIDSTLTVLGKGQGAGKLRHVPVSPQFRTEWQAYVLEHRLRPTSWLFPQSVVRFVPGERCGTERVTTDASRHCTPKAVRTVFGKVQELADDALRAGRLSDELRPPFALTPKVARRTYACCNLIASEMLGAGHGLDLRSLQEAMGHASLETTAMYLSDVASYMNRMRRPVSLVETAARLARPLDGNSLRAAPRGVARPTASAMRRARQANRRPAERQRCGEPVSAEPSRSRARLSDAMHEIGVRVPNRSTVEVHPPSLQEDRNVLYLRGALKEAKTLPPGDGFTEPTHLLTVLDEDGERMNVRATAEAHAAAEPLAGEQAPVEVRLERRRAQGIRGAAWRLTAVGIEAR